MFLINKKETVYVPRSFNMPTEEERIIRLWMHARTKPSYSREEFCSLLRKMLLNMFTSNVTQMKRKMMIEAFSAYCQKFPTVARHTSKILESVNRLHEHGLWGNSFFPWTNLFSKSVSVKDRQVQEYFATEPEEIVLARVHSYLMSKRVEEALIIAKNSLIYQLRVRKDGTLSSNNSLDPKNCKSLASADWFLLILQRKKSLSSIVHEVKELNCHEGLMLVNRLRKNPECKRFAYVMLQIFLVRDLIHRSSYCCTMKYFHLWCIVHKEMKSSHSEISNSARKMLSTYAPTSAHFYLFVDVLWKHFGSKLISLYVEFYIRGITADSNHLEAARNSNDVESLHLIERHLAKVFTKLSTLFSDIHEEASRECMFSAFSLRPKKQKLLILQSLTHSILDTESQHLTLTSNFCSPPTLTRAFYHPLLNTGVKCVSYFLIRDLVSSLEGVRRIDFQYNVFDWRNNAAELGKYVDSSEINSVSNEDSDTEYASNVGIKSTNSYPRVAETKGLVTNSEVHSTIKRKIDCSNKSHLYPLGVSTNVPLTPVGYSDKSNKKAKVQNLTLNQSAKIHKSQKQKAQPYFMQDAIEDVIKRTLDNQSSSSTNVGYSALFPQTSLQRKNHSVQPFSLTERGKQQNIFKNLAFPTKANLSSVHKRTTDINYEKQYISERNSSANFSTFEQPLNRESVVISPKVAKSFTNSVESSVQMSAGSIMKSESNNVAYFDKFTKYTQGNISSAKILNTNEALNLSSKDNYARNSSSSIVNLNPEIKIENSASSSPVPSNQHNKIAPVAHDSFLRHITQTSDLIAHQIPQRHKYSENVSTTFQCDTDLNKPIYNIHQMQAYENDLKSRFVTIKSEFDKPERYSVIQHTTQHVASDNSQGVPNLLNFPVKTEDKSTTKFPVKTVNKSTSGRNVSQLSKVFPPKTAVITQVALDTLDRGSESNNSLDLTSSVIMSSRWETSRLHHGTLKYKKNNNLIGVATTKTVYNKPHSKQKALLIRNPVNSNATVLVRTFADNPQVFTSQNAVDHVKSLNTKAVTSSQTWNPAQHLEYTNSIRTSIRDAGNSVTISSPAPNTSEKLNKRLNLSEYLKHDQYQDSKSHYSSKNDYFCNSSLPSASVPSASVPSTSTSPQYKNMFNEVNSSPHSLSNYSDSSYKHSTPPASSSAINESSSHSHSHSEYAHSTIPYQYNTVSHSSSNLDQTARTTVTSSRYSNTDYPGTESAPCCSPAEVHPCANCTKNDIHASVENMAPNQKFSRDICSNSSASTEMFSNSTKEECSTSETSSKKCENISNYDFLSNSATTLSPSNNVSFTKESSFENNGTPPFSQIENSDLQMELPDKTIKKQKISHSHYPNEKEAPYCGEFNHKSSILRSSVENQTNPSNIEENVLNLCVDLLSRNYQDLAQNMNSLSENQTISEQNTYFPSYSEEQNKPLPTQLNSSNCNNNNYNVRTSYSLNREKSNDLFSVNTSYEEDVFQSEQHKGKEFHKTPDEKEYSMSKPFDRDEKKLSFNSNNLDTKIAQSISNHFNSKKLEEGSLPGVRTQITCKICKLIVKTPAAMKRHVIRKHPDIPQECVMEAQLAVSTNSSLVTNKKASARIVKGDTCECQICGKVITKIYMKKHIKTQHLNRQIKIENLTEPVNNNEKPVFLNQNVDSKTYLSETLNKEGKSIARELSSSSQLEFLEPKLISTLNSPSSSTYIHKLQTPASESTPYYHNPHNSYFQSNLEKASSAPPKTKKRSYSKPTNCRICLRNFSSNGNLKRHFKTLHPKDGPPYESDHFNRSLNELESNYISPASTFVRDNLTDQKDEMKKFFPQSLESKNSMTELKVEKTETPVNFSQSNNVTKNSVSKPSVSSDWLFLNSRQNNFFSEAFPNNSTPDSLLDNSYNEQLSPHYENSHPQMVELVSHEKDAKSTQDSTSEYSQTSACKVDNEGLKYLVIEDNTYITDFNSSKCTTEDNSKGNFSNEYQNLQTEKEYIAKRDLLQYNAVTPANMKSAPESFLDPGINHSSLSVAENKTDFNMPALTDLNTNYANDVADVGFDPSFFDFHFRASSENATAFKNYSDDHLASFNGSSHTNHNDIIEENILDTFILKTENNPNPSEKFPTEKEAECFESIGSTDYYINSSELDKKDVKIYNSSDVSDICVEQQLVVAPSLLNEESNNQPKLSIPITDSFAAENKDFEIHSFQHIEENCNKSKNMSFDSYVTENCYPQSTPKSPSDSLPEPKDEVSDNCYNPALSSVHTSSEESTPAQSLDISQNDCNENNNLQIQQYPVENIMVKSNSEKCKLCQEEFSTMSELSTHLELIHCVPVLEKQPSFEQSKMLLEDTIHKLSPPNLLSTCYESESKLPSLEESAVPTTNNVDSFSQSESIEQSSCCDNMESEPSYQLDLEMNLMENKVSSPSNINLEENFSNILNSKFELISLKASHVSPRDVAQISSFDDDALELNLSNNARYESSFQTHDSLLKHAENCEEKSPRKTTMLETTDGKRNCSEKDGAESMSETCNVWTLSKEGTSKEEPEIYCKETGADAQDSCDNISSARETESKPEVFSCETVEELIEEQPSSVPESTCNENLHLVVPKFIGMERKLHSMVRRHSFSNSRSKQSNDVDKSAYKTLEYLDLEFGNRSKITIYEISRSNQKIDPNSRIVHPLVLRKKKFIETLYVNPHKFPPKTNLQFCTASKDVCDAVINSEKIASLTKVKQLRKKKHRTCFRTKKHQQRISKSNSTFGKRSLFFKKFRRKRHRKLLISSRNTVPSLKLTFNKKETVQFLKTHQQPVVKLTRLKLKNRIAYSRRNSVELKQDSSLHIPRNSSKIPIVVLEKINFGNEITNASDNLNVSRDVLPIKAEINVLGENDVLNVNCRDLFGSSEDDSLHMEHQFLSSERDVSNVKISVLLKNIKIGLESNKFDENQNTDTTALSHKCLNQNRDCKGLNCVEPPPGKKCCVLLQRLPS